MFEKVIKFQSDLQKLGKYINNTNDNDNNTNDGNIYICKNISYIKILVI